MSTKKKTEDELPIEEGLEPAETPDTAESPEPPAQEDGKAAKAAKAAKAYRQAGATEDWQKKWSELNERYLRMAAEYDNFRKRSAKEREGLHGEAVAHAVAALLPTYDNLERALKTETADAEYKKGVELTLRQMNEALKGLGVVPVEDAPGTAFDPNLHNAVMHVEDDTLGEGVIAETFQRGFTLKDKVIRHSMVKVAN